jgi:hypothetical protein
MLPFEEFMKKKRGNKWIKKYEETVFVGLDPGATTGVCEVINGIVVNKGQLDTGKGENYNKQVKVIFDYLNDKKPKFIVCEDYRIYEDKAKIHIGMRLYVPELLGIIKTWAYLNDCTVIMQPAIIIKRGFITNDKVKTWGYGKIPGGHSNNHWHDALKHLMYALLFNKDIN